MSKSLIALALAALFALQTTSCVGAESVYSEQNKLIRGGRDVTTLGADLFGDTVSLYNTSITNPIFFCVPRSFRP